MVTLCVILSASLTSRCHQSAQVSIPARPAAGSTASGRSHCLDAAQLPSVRSGIAKLHHVPPHLIPLLSGVCGQYKWYSLSKNQVQSLALPLDTGPHHSEPQFSHLSDGIVTVGVFLTGLSGDKDVVWCPDDAWPEAG